MPRVDKRTYAFYGKDEAAANKRFNEHLDQGHSVLRAIELVKEEFPAIPEELVAWWMG